MKYIIILLTLIISLNAKSKIEYYEMLKNNCKDSCCLYSYNIMINNSYVLHNDAYHCINIETLKCITSYKWCNTTTYEDTIYIKNKNNNNNN